MGPEGKEGLVLGEIGPIMDQWTIDLATLAATCLLAVKAEQVHRREGKLPVNVKEACAFNGVVMGTWGLTFGGRILLEGEG